MFAYEFRSMKETDDDEKKKGKEKEDDDNVYDKENNVREVIVKYPYSEQPALVNLNIKDTLSTVRTILKDNDKIQMNGIVLFSRKTYEGKFAEIARRNENEFELNKILEKSE
ncbi:594_t:CDS:1, partial [Funneliformis geosporum]